MSGRRGEGRAQTGRAPRPHPAPPEKIKPWQRRWVGRQGRKEARQVEEGRGGQGEEREIQAQVGGNPVQSKANQNFKPYLRCLTSGEPDLGKGTEREKERKKKKKEKGERNKENTSHQNQPERGEEKSFCCHNLKTLFNL